MSRRTPRPLIPSNPRRLTAGRTDPAQIGNAKQRGGTLRNPRHGRNANDFGNVLGAERIEPSVRSGMSGSAASAAPSAAIHVRIRHSAVSVHRPAKRFPRSRPPGLPRPAIAPRQPWPPGARPSWLPRPPTRSAAHRPPFPRRPQGSRPRLRRSSCWPRPAPRLLRRFFAAAAATVRLFCTSISDDAMICSRRGLQHREIWSRIPRTVSVARSTFSEASRARLRMSLDTTANPRPESPARAASTEPLTASMLVWMATSAMPPTILSILRPTVSSAFDRRHAGLAYPSSALGHAVHQALDRTTAFLERRDRSPARAHWQSCRSFAPAWRCFRFAQAPPTSGASLMPASATRD